MSLSLKAGQQFFVQPAKAPVAQHTNNITRLRCCRHMGRNGMSIRQVSGLCSVCLQGLHESTGIQAIILGQLIQASHLGHHHRIRLRQGLH